MELPIVETDGMTDTDVEFYVGAPMGANRESARYTQAAQFGTTKIQSLTDMSLACPTGMTTELVRTLFPWKLTRSTESMAAELRLATTSSPRQWAQV